jgi:hypothetical protein
MLSKIFHIFVPLFLLCAGLLGTYVFLLSIGLEPVSFTFLVGFPFIAGLLIVRFRPEGSFGGFGQAFLWMISVLFLSMALSVISGLEGLICVAMAVVPLMIFTLAGGFIYLLILRGRSVFKDTAKAFVLPIAVIALLGQSAQGPEIYAIRNSILIDAQPSDVFASIQSIPDIKPEEVPTRLSHLLGVPKPTAAIWENNSDGQYRHSYWSDDVHFIEKITAFEENKRISWDFVFPENWIVEGIEDPHVKVGGKYFDILSGGYELEEIDGQTRLTLTTHTLDNSGLGFYAKFWHHFFFEDFHKTILVLVKNRIEATS